MEDKIKIYMAGSLFSEAEIVGRKHEYQIIKKAFPNADIFSPVMADFNTSKDTMLPTAIDIYEGDFKEIKSSDYVILDFGDIHDPGVNGEAGLIAGLNHAAAKRIIPIAIISDIRLGSSNKYQIPPYGINHFQLGLVQSEGFVVGSLSEAIEKIKKLELDKKRFG